ncbi:MAG: DNA repair protein RecN [Candidatus Methylumidiphilus alinenensis]|uniref:DNA repair protein RecN n=1 Tax=Candidatus Methylumidiphilus alinenensis TaxID=2202197 RepID=A0A2W4TA29_9GAMM|nr:MAG: DNA repair protein RecN [Candidatus Methylumidiphilus alinenensis]
MLCNLNIKDLAVVESLSLELALGLTVLTGETGAGKSILLTALGLALGERADSGLIRPGASRAEINLEFSVADARDARLWLEENELSDDEEVCLIRRVVSQDGRSRAFINNRPATLQSLQELASMLVEIHGQHAHLRLLDGDEQRRLLDESAGNKTLLEKLAGIFRHWRSVRDELDANSKTIERGTAREELLRYQIEEMEQHGVEALDYDLLSEEQTLQANMEKILAAGQTQLEQLYDDEKCSVNALLAQAIHAMADIGHIAPDFSEIETLLTEAQIQVKEAVGELRRRMEKMEADPKRLAWVDEKLGELHRLARKHHVAPRDLRQHVENLRTELGSIELGTEKNAQLRQEMEKLEREYRELAVQLSKSRLEGGRKLEAQISSVIRELGMPQGQFIIETTPAQSNLPTLFGNDRIEFLVSANPGLPPRPLGKVASGGELSRISLAIQVAATDAKTTPTLVFDEVDSGIGGGVAEIVGQKLRLLGKDRQIFCVTHLHQVAALGHQHLLVEKTIDKTSTKTQVRKLAPNQRKHEIARMLGGVRITEQTLAHAEEMLAASGSSLDI